MSVIAPHHCMADCSLLHRQVTKLMPARSIRLQVRELLLTYHLLSELTYDTALVYLLKSVCVAYYICTTTITTNRIPRACDVSMDI